MCSIHSATDQRSGSILKFHCASERPLVASRTSFSCGFEELQGLVLVCLRELLRPGRPATGHYKSATNNESQRSRNALHNLPFPQIGIRGSPKRFPEICEGHGEAARWRVECAPQAFRCEVIPRSKPVRRSLRGKGPARR